MGKDIVKTDGTGLAEREQSASITEAAEVTKSEMMVQAQVGLAKRYPRDEEAAHDRLIQTCKRPAFAEKALYAYPRGGAMIIGPGIRVAEEAARVWGNIQTGFIVVDDSPTSRTIRGMAWDLESNAMKFAEDTFEKLIYRKQGGWQKPDERDLRELTNKRAAILVRNCTFQLLPVDLLDEITATCKASCSKGGTKKAQAETPKIVDAFAALGIAKKELEDYMKREVEKFTAEDLAILRPIYNAIKDGVAKKDEYFKPVQDAPVEITVEEGLDK